MPGWLFLQRVTHLTTESSLWIAIVVIEILMLAGLSFMLRRGARWLVATMIVMFIAASLLAVMTLAIIRA